VAGDIGSSAGATTAAKLTGHREAEPTRPRRCSTLSPPAKPRQWSCLGLFRGAASSALVRTSPILAFQRPEAFFGVLQVVCRYPTAAHGSRGHGETPLGELVGGLVPGRRLFARPPSRQSPLRSPRRCSSSRLAHKPSSGGTGPREAPIYRNWNAIQNSLIHQCGLVPETLRCDRLAVERKNR
jgi:hypothetical protein